MMRVLILETLIPTTIQDFARLVDITYLQHAVIIRLNQRQLPELAERIINLKIQLTLPVLPEPLFYHPVQLLGIGRLIRMAPEKKICQHRLLALLLFSVIDQAVKNTGIVIQVLEIQVLCDGLHKQQLAVLEVAELSIHKTTERTGTKQERNQSSIIDL